MAMVTVHTFPIEVDVPTAGATITGPEGFCMVFPAGFFSKSTRVTVPAPVQKEDCVHGFKVASRGYTIQSDKPPWQGQATIYIPYFNTFESSRPKLVVRRGGQVSDCDPGVWEPTTRKDDKAGVMGGKTVRLGVFVVMKPVV